MANLAAETKDMGFRLEQVQDFTPTPMTVATVIYYSGYHPYTMKEMFTAKTEKEKKDQQMFFFWHKKEYRKKIKENLVSKGREDLVERLLFSDSSQNKKLPENKRTNFRSKRIKKY